MKCGICGVDPITMNGDVFTVEIKNTMKDQEIKLLEFVCNNCMDVIVTSLYKFKK